MDCINHKLIKIPLLALCICFFILLFYLPLIRNLLDTHLDVYFNLECIFINTTPNYRSSYHLEYILFSTYLLYGLFALLLVCLICLIHLVFLSFDPSLTVSNISVNIHSLSAIGLVNFYDEMVLYEFIFHIKVFELIISYQEKYLDSKFIIQFYLILFFLINYYNC